VKMDNKGQFTIIAALLVAVILIGTVVSTYSAIRYSTTEDQPQVLSSVDETNLALKQLLGFTLGYYGSVLQVTGNTTFAQNITKTYLNSGLISIANTKPELGLSFNVTSVELQVEWFGASSYSSGRLNVTYDMVGLGFYGLKYSPVCQLKVQILPSISGQAHVLVLQDAEEPLNTLNIENFKFYKYLDTETWSLTPPSSIGEITLGGAYSINIPSGVDSKSYMVQVEDTRGIMVVASSFSHFVSTSTWSTSYASVGDYVDQSSNVDASQDKGTQSLFESLKLGPDSVFDTLTEENYSPSIQEFVTQLSNVDGSGDLGTHSNFALQQLKDENFDTLTESNSGSGATLVNSESFEGAWPPSGWSADGRWDKESNRAYSGSYSADFDGPWSGSSSGDLITPALDCSGSTLSISVDFWYYDQGVDNNEFVLQYYNGHSWIAVAQLGNGAENTWQHYQEQITDSQYFRANFRVRWSAIGVDNGEHAYVDLVSIQKVSQPTYQLDLEEQFTNVDYNQANEQLCIFAGSLGSESLQVDVRSGSTWTTVIYALQPNQWNNVSVASYLSSPTFTIRFKGGIEAGDNNQDSWQIDCALLHTWTITYQLDIECQFTNVNYTQINEWLCIYAGSLSAEPLRVDVRSGSNWVNVISNLQPNQWNNVSVSSWLTGSMFTIRFNGGIEAGDTTQDQWNIDAVMLQLDSNYDFFGSLQDSTMVVEWLQNGTMRRLGQNLNLTTSALPIPPIPVKAIHVNQTFVNGTNREVPFQIEDWASNYSIPLGLTNNATVFSNKQMIVYLIDKTVAETSIWWNGSDQAVQTRNAFANVYFTADDPTNNRLSNGRATLEFGSGFTLTSRAGTTTSTASFMRINSEASVYGASPAYVIHHGVVRDIVQQEAEWNDGANNCPNLYANIVITLPAKTTYYTYQLRIMFLNSQQPRTINDLCPIKLTSSFNTVQTENGTSSKIPIVATGSGTYYNSAYPSSPGTAHHWSQMVTGSSGTGLMFTDSANKLLYSFDSFVGSATGAIKTVSGTTDTIELLPVTRFPANNYNNALDITWRGAVATFSGSSTPVYEENGGTPTGLWVLAEYQPTIAVSAVT
jgi:hypothetical protein